MLVTGGDGADRQPRGYRASQRRGAGHGAGQPFYQFSGGSGSRATNPGDTGDQALVLIPSDKRDI